MNAATSKAADLVKVQREIGFRGGLHRFVKMAWHIVEPGRPFTDGWHIGAICEHLEAVSKGQIRRLVINMPPGCMKPVDETMRVMLADGRRVPLRDVGVGDFVISHRGRPCRVEAVHVQGELPTLCITTESGRSVTAAHDHPFLTPSGWVQAANLRVGDVLGQPIPENRRGTSVPCEAFRLAGYFVGDGNTTSTKASCQANITCLDFLQGADIEKCARAMGFACKYSGKRYNLSGGVRRWLKDTGLAGKTSWTKRVPTFVFEGSNDQIADFVGAYFACDGTLTRKAPARADLAVTFSSVNRKLLEDVQHLLYRLGVRARIRKHFAKYNTFAKGPYTSWRLTISSQDDTSKFISRVPVWGVKAARLEAWGVVRRDFDREMLPDPIVDISDAGLRPCRCLSVNEDKSFTAEDIAVHNSLSCNVFWPVWDWIQDPAQRFFYASFDQRLVGQRDGGKCIELVQSPWFRARWADRVQISNDAAAGEFYTQAKGMRFSTSPGGRAMGYHANKIVLDDLAKPSAMSDDYLAELGEWRKQTLASRGLPGAGVVLVMQRLHENDPAGQALREREDDGKPSYEHLLLPMRFESARACSTSIGFKDPRTTEGELLWPAYKSEEEVRAQEKDMGSQVAAAQLQQRPSPAGGLIFQRTWMTDHYYTLAPSRFDASCVSYDFTFKDVSKRPGGKIDFVGCGVYGRKGADFYLLDLHVERLDFPSSLALVKKKSREWPRVMAKLVEDKANGPAVISMLKKDVPGLIPVTPEGGKEARANAVAPCYEAGNVHYPHPDGAITNPERQSAPVKLPFIWDGKPCNVDPHVDSMAGFPFAAHDDDVDTETQAILYLRRRATKFLEAMQSLQRAGLR